MLGTITNRISHLIHTGAAYEQSQDERALRHAMETGDRAAFKRLLARRPSLANAEDENGSTPLHWLLSSSYSGLSPALHRDRREMMACLLDAQADLHVRDAEGFTALHRAAMARCPLDMLGMLLARGADVRAVARGGDTALHLALRQESDEATVLLLLDHGADPQWLDREGRTAGQRMQGRQWHDRRLARIAAGAGPSTGAGVAASASAPRPPHRRGPPTVPAAVLSDLARRCLDNDLPPEDCVNALETLTRVLKTRGRLAAEAADDDCVAHAIAILTSISSNLDRRDLHACTAAMRSLHAAAPDAAEIRADSMLGLYEALTRMWQRFGHWKEAMAYAFSALRVAADAADIRRIEALLDRLEWTMTNEALQDWTSPAVAELRASLLNVAQDCVRLRYPLSALQHAAPLLRRAAQIHAALRGREGAGDGIPVDHLWQAADAVLKDARASPARADDFVQAAALVLAMAQDLGRLGRCEDGARLCELVVLHRAEECSGALRTFEASQHQRLADDLRRQGWRSEPAPALWRELRQILSAARDEARRDCAELTLPMLDGAEPGEPPLAFETVQARLAAAYRAAVGRIAEVCEMRMLSDPPCAFAVVGLGSIARDDVLPFSDVEFVVLTALPANEAPAVGEWFRRYCRLLELAFHGAGEFYPGQEHPLSLPRGFERDSSVGGSDVWGEWIGTPQQWLKRLRQSATRDRRDLQHTGPGLEASLLSATLLHGDAVLLLQLHDGIRQRGSGPGEKGGDMVAPAPGVDIAFRQLHADWCRMNAELDRGRQAADPIDLKGRYLGPLVHALSLIGHCVGCEETVPRAILCRFGQAGRFAPAFLADWRRAYVTVQLIRCRAQLAAGTRQDTVSLQGLNADEQAALHAIEWRVVRPLWRAVGNWLLNYNVPGSADAAEALRREWLALDHCDPALLPFPAPDARRAAGNARAAPHWDAAAITALVATLASRSGNDVLLRHYYETVLAAMPERRRMACWSIWREGFSGPAYADALAGLATWRDINGWSGAAAQARSTFLEGLACWVGGANLSDFVIALPTWDEADDRVCIEHQPLSGDIAAQLFDAHGKPRVAAALPGGDGGAATLGVPVRWRDRDGRVRVCRVRFHTEHAAAELIVHPLAARVGGTPGMPLAWPARLDGAGCSYAVQVVEDIDGPSLAACLQADADSLRRIDAAAFTRALLRVLLSDPVDEGTQQYVLPALPDGTVGLCRVGPHCTLPGGRFWPPGAGSTRGRGSALLDLDQMILPLDTGVLRELRRLDVAALVQAWLEEVGMWERRLDALFSSPHAPSIFAPESRAQLLAVAFPDNAVRMVVQRLETLRGIVALADDLGIVPTGMDLLKAVRPHLASGLVQGFERFPVSSDGPSRVRDRIAWLDGAKERPLYHTVSVRAVQVATPLSPSLPVDRAQPFAPLMPVLHPVPPEHARIPRTTDLRALAMAVLDGEAHAAGRFLGLASVQRGAIVEFLAQAKHLQTLRWSAPRQARLLRALSGTPLRQLNLQPFAEVVDDDLLCALLRPCGGALRVLDLSGCQRITPGGLARAVELVPNLEYLALQKMGLGNVGTGAVADRRWTLPGRLEALRILDVSRNPVLGTLRLDAPNLTALNLSGCSRLHDIRIGSKALTLLDASGCVRLGESALMVLAGEATSLTTLRLTGCALRHVPWRQRYPWLQGRAWDRWTDREVNALDAALQGEPGGRALADAAIVRRRVREWLATRDDGMERLSSIKGDWAWPDSVRAGAVRTLDSLHEANANASGAQAVAMLTGMPEDASFSLAAVILQGLTAGTAPHRVLAAMAVVAGLLAIPSRHQVLRWHEEE